MADWKNIDQGMIHMSEFDANNSNVAEIEGTSGVFQKCAGVFNIMNPILVPVPINSEYRNFIYHEPIQSWNNGIINNIPSNFKSVTPYQQQTIYGNYHSVKFAEQNYSETIYGYKQRDMINIDKTYTNPVQFNKEINILSEQNVKPLTIVQKRDLENVGLVNNSYYSQKRMSLYNAIQILPKPFNGENMALGEFFEKCEFALSRVVESAIPKLLKTIRTRIVGDLRKIIKNKILKTWEDLRDLLTSSLHPKNIKSYLYFQLYELKQMRGENVMTYAKKIIRLEKLIIEQETSELSPEIAKTITVIINRQVIQCFIQGLRKLKYFTSACNPLTLEEAVQIARDEECSRKSIQKTKDHVCCVQQSSSIKCLICGIKGYASCICAQNIHCPPTYMSYHHSSESPSTCHDCRNPDNGVEDCKTRHYIQLNREQTTLNRSEFNNYVQEALNELSALSFYQSEQSN